jgi:hypothetical protein
MTDTLDVNDGIKLILTDGRVEWFDTVSTVVD